MDHFISVIKASGMSRVTPCAAVRNTPVDNTAGHTDWRAGELLPWMFAPPSGQEPGASPASPGRNTDVPRTALAQPRDSRSGLGY